MNSVSGIGINFPGMNPSVQGVDATSAVNTVGQVDRAGFAKLIEEHQDRLRGFLYRYTRNMQDAEDLAQDTFVKAYRNLHRYDSKYNFSTWLYTIARRTAYNHFRDKKPTEAMEYDIVDSAPRPDDEAQQDDQKSWVWEAAQELKPALREALVLKYVEDLSIQEISKIMGKTQTNVKIILFRARNQLKAMQKKMERSEQ